MTWDNPEPGVYEAYTTVEVPVHLEVFQPDDNDLDRYLWFALREGRIIHEGVAVGLEEAKRQCEASLL